MILVERFLAHTNHFGNGRVLTTAFGLFSQLIVVLSGDIEKFCTKATRTQPVDPEALPSTHRTAQLIESATQKQ